MRFATIFIFALGTVFGQDFRATITGEITDKTGAAIAGARIRAIQRSTNQAIEAVSNQDGRYTLPYLQPSTFDIEVTREGFITLRRTNITLLVAEKLDLPMVLELGAVTQQVTVSASVETVQSAEASGGLNFDSLQTSEYPLNG